MLSADTLKIRLLQEADRDLERRLGLHSDRIKQLDKEIRNSNEQLEILNHQCRKSNSECRSIGVMIEGLTEGVEKTRLNRTEYSKLLHLLAMTQKEEGCLGVTEAFNSKGVKTKARVPRLVSVFGRSRE